MIYFVWQNPMTTPVAWQELNLAPTERSANERVGGRPKRRIDLMFGDVLDFLHLIQPAAADDADCWNLFLHARCDLIARIGLMESA